MHGIPVPCPDLDPDRCSTKYEPLEGRTKDFQDPYTENDTWTTLQDRLASTPLLNFYTVRDICYLIEMHVISGQVVSGSKEIPAPRKCH